MLGVLCTGFSCVAMWSTGPVCAFAAMCIWPVL